MLAVLPVEVVGINAEHVTATDSCACQAVCRSWRPIFQALLFWSVSIETRGRLKSFLRLTRSIGHLTQELEIEYGVGLLKHELEQLAANLCNLRRIRLDNRRYKGWMQSMRLFSKWTKLCKVDNELCKPQLATSLINDIGSRRRYLSLSEWTAQILIDSNLLMQSLPNLEHLSLAQDANSPVGIRPSRLAAMYHYLPFLRCLGITPTALQREDNMSVILDFTFESIQVLKLSRCVVHEPRWLEQFLYLFPRIKAAEFDIKLDNSDANINRNQQLSLALLTGFPNLQCIQFRSNYVADQDLIGCLQKMYTAGRRFESIQICDRYDRMSTSSFSRCTDLISAA